MSNSRLSATYSPEDNKLRLYSSSRLEADTYARVKAAGFSWAPKQDLFVAPCWTPQREDLLLDLCGEIGDEDTSLVERAEERAERFEGYQEHRAKDAERAHAAVSAIADGIPLGQPILVGHHSERHARRDAEKIENGMRRAVNAWKTSEYWKRRAAGALSHAKYKELPAVRSRRIKTLEAELRKVQRDLDKAKKFSQLWASIEAPAKDGGDCTDELRMKRALLIANVDHVHASFSLVDYPRPEDCTSTYEGSQGLWSALDSRTITPGQAAEIAIPAHARTIADRERWIEQLENRLAYERAMLAESGYQEPKLEKPAPLPLLNYPGTVSYRSPYHRGEVVTGEAVPITKAELAAVNSDYKGTRVSADGTHRVRVAMHLPGRRHELTAVFLTDSKTHKLPSAELVTAKAEEEEQESLQEAQERHERVMAARARVTPPSPQAGPEIDPATGEEYPAVTVRP